MSAPQQLFVAEGTFGVLDGGDIPVDTADWSNGLAAPMSHGAVILTGIRTGDVQVTAEAHNTPLQTDDHASWEEIVEVSVLCESGQLLVESLDLGPAEDLPDLASAGSGWYRIRVHAHGRNTNPDGTDSDPIEHYLLTAWPSTSAETAILKSSQRIAAELARHAGQPGHAPQPTPPADHPLIKPE
ncbi:hypothetical protein [Streptomyces scabiei]|uniref:hypothetical protein n=1 Tax=Streptomyces scabiei TaxID=1930 RepID=UPI000691C620|nr:hypothetical protein [Streptomyces scabiei]